MVNLKKIIYQKLETAFSPKRLDVKDESYLHKHHKQAPPSGQSHFSVLMVSDQFSGLGRLERHQLVYQALKAEMETKIHALTLKLYTSEEDIPR